MLASAPVLMLVQLLLLPLYVWLFMGDELRGVVRAGPFLEAFLVLIVLPFGLALVTEAWAVRQPSGARMTAAMVWLPVPFMALTLLVIVASQLPEIKGELGEVARVVPIFAAYLVAIPPLAYLAAHRFALGTTAGRALVFSSATRNSLVVLPLALALPAGYAITPAVIVTQTLVELTGLIVYTRLIPPLWPLEPTHNLRVPAD